MNTVQLVTSVRVAPVQPLVLEAPAEWAAKVREMFAELDIPESEIKRLLAEALFTPNAYEDWGQWVTKYDYPNRDTGEKQLNRLWAHVRARLETHIGKPSGRARRVRVATSANRTRR
jgi:hypothetical protein